MGRTALTSNWRLRQVQCGVKSRGGDTPSSNWRLRQVQCGVKRRGVNAKFNLAFTPGPMWREASKRFETNTQRAYTNRPNQTQAGIIASDGFLQRTQKSSSESRSDLSMGGADSSFR